MKHLLITGLLFISLKVAAQNDSVGNALLQDDVSQFLDKDRTHIAFTKSDLLFQKDYFGFGLLSMLVIYKGGPLIIGLSYIIHSLKNRPRDQNG